MPESFWANEWDARRQECWRLLWPALSLVRRGIGSHRLIVGSKMAVFQEQSHQEQLQCRNNYVLKDDTDSMLFLKPGVLATMELDIHERMWSLETSKAPVMTPLVDRCPHYKTYARVMAPKEESFCTPPIDNPPLKSTVTECCCPDLAWFLLTSACLSRGAQGELVPHVLCRCCGNIRQGYIQFRNFELGVLFHSTNRRTYKALSENCPVHSGGENLYRSSASGAGSVEVIVLPVPYDILGGVPYCVDGKFRRRPYMSDLHELVKVGAQLELPEETPLKRLRSRESIIDIVRDVGTKVSDEDFLNVREALVVSTASKAVVGIVDSSPPPPPSINSINFVLQSENFDYNCQKYGDIYRRTSYLSAYGDSLKTASSSSIPIVKIADSGSINVTSSHDSPGSAGAADFLCD